MPLHLAAAFGHIRSVEHLCNPEVINVTGANGKTALHYAINDNNAQLVEFLLKHGADVNGDQSHEHRQSPLIEALEECNYKIVDILMDFNADPGGGKVEKGWHPLHFAAFRGRAALARRLLDAGCDPNPHTDRGYTPFFLALSRNHTEIMDILLARGILDMAFQKSYSGVTYAYLAAKQGRLDLFQQLVTLDKSVLYETDVEGNDTLGIAAGAGQYGVVDFLIQSGVSPNGTSAAVLTPLSRATVVGSMKTVRILLKGGAKVDKLDQYLRPSLSWAIICGRRRIANSLLKAGANPHLRDAMVCFAEVSPFLCYLSHQ